MSNYWRKREQSHIKKREKNVMKIARRLKKNQLQVMDDIETQIHEFYGRYADKEGISIEEAKKRATKLDIKKYEKKARDYVKASKSKDEEVRQRAFTKTDRKSTRLNSSHVAISYAVFCLKK